MRILITHERRSMQSEKRTLLCADNMAALSEMPENSIDAVVTDPPYGLSFMGKRWDYDVPSVELWRKVLRVLKPGGHVLSFGGTRTYHRMVVNLEDAGFEIRDQLQWLYGSGFPKSLDISKAIDKAAGAEREVVGENPNWRPAKRHGAKFDKWQDSGIPAKMKLTKPATASAKAWQGWGTALKPANEPICLARKPLDGTVAENVEKYGVGGLNIDESRIAHNEKCRMMAPSKSNIEQPSEKCRQAGRRQAVLELKPEGRWPANVILDEEAAAMLDEQAKDVARFFYCAKASKSERNAGLDDMPLREVGIKNDSGRGFSESDQHKKIMAQNHHPTVKPIALMRYLCKLITPPGGTILDPFMGSGTTGIAAKLDGFGFVGIELSAEYFEIAQKRIESWVDNAK